MSNTTKIAELSKRLAEPEWLLSWREARAEQAAALPVTEQYGISISGVSLGEENTFASFAEYQVTPSKGLELYTWKEAITQEEITPFLERLMTSELFPRASAHGVALGQSLFQTGLVVYVQPTLDDAGNPKEETLTIETAIPLGAASDIVIVIAKEGSQLKMESILKGGEASSMFVRTMIVLMESGAKAAIVTRTNGAKGLAMMEHAALVSAHASCDFVEDPQSAMVYRSHTTSLLLGEEATSEILHTLIGTENASYDIWAGAEHRASDTHSRIYALGLGGANSKIVYRGMIDMKKGVHAVDGAQEGKFLIVSPHAEIDAIPELDIASKDVASTHKLSVSHIRDIDLFYAKTRGIPEAEAREIAIEGFFGSLLSRIKKEEIMESVRERIARLTNTKP